VALTNNLSACEQHAHPYSFVPFTCPDQHLLLALNQWYPTTSLMCENHHTHHTKLQAALTINIKPRAYTNTRLSNTGMLLYISALLIIQAADIETNPGPVKYPCQVCDKAVRWNQKAVACDNCDMWHHVNCMGMAKEVYDAINTTDASWICWNCGIPNFSTSLFDTLVIESNNTFEPLAEVSIPLADTSLPDNIGSPLHASSPTSAPRPSPAKRKTKQSLKVLTVNIQSIHAKKESLWNLIDTCDPDIILGCETWLSDQHSDGEILPAGYKPYRNNRVDGYGGVMIAVKLDLISEEIPFNTNNTELIAAQIQLAKNNNLVICAAYRPPKEDLQYTNNLCEALQNLCQEHRSATIWLGGDFNLPDIDWTSDSITSHQYTIALNNAFINTFADTNLEQIVDEPTRNDRTLDLFLTNRPSLVNRCKVIPGVSDHEAVLVDSMITAKRHKPPRRKVYLWKRADMTSIRTNISQYAETLTTNPVSNDIDQLWDNFKKVCEENMNAHVPSKMSSTRYSQPWITKQLKRLTQKKQTAYNKAKVNNTDENWAMYKRLKAQTQMECRRAYKNFLHDSICGEKSTKKFWGWIKSKKCDNTGVAPLKRNGVAYSDNKTKAEILNDQFVSVFSKEDETIPDLGHSNHPTLPPITVECSGVRKLLRDINPHKASGPDKISSQFLKESADELAPALTHIFQQSINQGRIPSDWRNALITPLFKKGDKSQPANYRPISLTSVCCKLLEHIIHSNIITFLDENGILNDAQHGFRKRRSCESQLILTINDLAKGLDAGSQIDAILLDFSKAFDKVPHRRLMAKLHHYGIRGTTHAWIQDFLKDRTQQVVLEGEVSAVAPVTSGVPQGTVLGPLLFLVYINDLPDCVTATTRLFADDSLVYRTIKTPDDCRKLQEDLDRLQEWENKWQMSFNPDKCEVLTITNKRKPIQAAYNIHGVQLKLVETAKYLGLNINCHLSWNLHIDKITKKANSTRAFLQRNLRGCPTNIKAQSYRTFVRPTLEYASMVWDPHTQQNIKKLEAVQRRSARFVCNVYNRTSSVTALLNELHWQSLKQRRLQSKVTMTYKILHDLIDIPSSLYNQATLRTTTRGHD
jgi:hypothetical protein